MTKEIQNIIALYKAGDEKNRAAAGVLLGGLPFKYLREFCEHYATEFKECIKAEFIPVTVAGEFDFVTSDLTIKVHAEQDAGGYFAEVFINDLHVFGMSTDGDGWRLIISRKKKIDLISKELLK